LDNSIRRRRECLACGKRFTTFETYEPMIVVKKDGTRQVFDHSKILAGVQRACKKRPVSYESLVKFVDDIETELRNLQLSEIPTRTIGELVMSKLLELDDVAHIRFASVYHEFATAEDFVQLVGRS